MSKSVQQNVIVTRKNMFNLNLKMFNNLISFLSSLSKFVVHNYILNTLTFILIFILILNINTCVHHAHISYSSLINLQPITTGRSLFFLVLSILLHLPIALSVSDVIKHSNFSSSSPVLISFYSSLHDLQLQTVCTEYLPPHTYIHNMHTTHILRILYV